MVLEHYVAPQKKADEHEAEDFTPEMILMQNERKRVKFSVEELTSIMDGGPATTKERRETGSI